MRAEARLFGFGVFVFIPLALIYGHFTRWVEPVGVFGLFLLAALSALVGFYLSYTGKRISARPEDDPAAPIEAAEGDYGFFSPHSWWPLALGVSAGLTFLGLAVGWWIAICALPIGIVSLVGWSFEYFRGENAV